MTRILFYGEHKDYGFLSNYYPSPMEINGKTYATNEHYFQSKKFEGTPHEQEIIDARSPSMAKRLGRSRSFPIRSDWEEIKCEIMHQGLRAKFTQHAHLREKLIATAGFKLVEHTTRDRYWGDGGDGSGKNMLGKILMKVRDELIGEEMSK